jgi:hypothetical protein
VRYSSAQHRTLGLVALALLALTTGVFVYLLDRPAGSAELIPAVLQLSTDEGRAFGPSGDWLPSLVHVYAFILLTAAVMRPSPRNLLLVCTGWLVIEAFFELIQHPAVTQLLVDQASSWSGRLPVLATLHDYAVSGAFDPMDLVGLALGVVAAYLTVRWAWKKEEPS